MKVIPPAAGIQPYVQVDDADVHGLCEHGHELVEGVLLLLVLRQAHVLEGATWQVGLEELKSSFSCKHGADSSSSNRQRI